MYLHDCRMLKTLFPLLILLLPGTSLLSQRTEIKYLSGLDKDHPVWWNFYCTGGRNSGKWTKIAVPSNWELQGFGDYNYGHDKVKSNEQGLYKYTFPSDHWNGKRVFLVFEGVMTDTKVIVNGKDAGPIHQGGFYRFKYDITDLLLPQGGKNLLEITVSKTSANASVNDAERRNSDFWIFGGIFRSVYLEIVPGTFIDRLAIDAKADGSLRLDVFAQHLKGDERIEAQVQTLTGEPVGKPFSVVADTNSEKVQLRADFNRPWLWSAEFPNLYQVVVALKSGGRVTHQIKQKFGFRTFELRTGDGIYLNGVRVMLKGVCRHSFWPESGRTLSYAVQLQDVRLMKEMNMNAVRMSHYPPDREFLNVCDSMGLYVLDELTGWQAKYDTTAGRKLVREMVIRDVNHPSILFWDNGNEGGWNRALDGDYARYDPQERTVLHPWEKFNGADTKHYPDYNYISKSAAAADYVLMPTEFMHGLYDGGAGAGLDDFWNAILKHPHGAGGFIWAFLDEAVVRTDKNGILDGDGNHAPDGIVGPHREKEASFYSIKEIWSPVYIESHTVSKGWDGNVPIENRYAFTQLRQCTFRWRLARLPSPGDRSVEAIIGGTGQPVVPDLAPGDSGVLSLRLPANWWTYDVLYLTAYGPDKRELFTWSWPIDKPNIVPHSSPPLRAPANRIQPRETDSTLRIACDGINYYFDRSTGYLRKVVNQTATISLSNGPVLAGGQTELRKMTHHAADGQYIVEADYGGKGSLQIKWTFAPGSPAKLDYRYSPEDSCDFMGITFNYPEEKITGMKWLGRGPYRVWKNRLKGQRYGVWHKAYNNTITGETWGYPEFKGYHAAVGWVVVENKESPFTVYISEKNMYFQMLRPAREKDALANNNVEPPFPAGSIGFLQAIPAIGTKFQAAKLMGPQSQQNRTDGQPVSGTLWFDFGSHDKRN
jgi:Glycosyl hydrolases family 2, TIM barrel domain/Glycosyl hydrolases family 2, sugar binding domain/Glycosyl hydrolases family 2/Beta galactosidase small chain